MKGYKKNQNELARFESCVNKRESKLNVKRFLPFFKRTFLIRNCFHVNNIPILIPRNKTWTALFLLNEFANRSTEYRQI